MRPGRRIRSANHATPCSCSDPWHDYAAYRYIKALCRSIKPDVVHTHSSKAGIVGRIAAAAARKPLVVHTIHGLPFHPYQSRFTNAAWIAMDALGREKIRCHYFRRRRHDPPGPCREYRPAGTIHHHLQRHGCSAIHPVRALPCRSSSATGHSRGPPRISAPSPGCNRSKAMMICWRLPTRSCRVPKAHFLWVGDGIFRPRFEAIVRRRAGAIASLWPD